MTSGCLDEDVLGQLVEGRLPEPVRAEVLDHLDGCPRCRRLVAMAWPADDGPDDGADDGEPTPDGAGAQPDGFATAATVDARGPRSAPEAEDAGRPRYAIGARLLATDTGQLHAAHDHRLRRDVVIERRTPEPPGGLERLRAQARVQARIDHPNIARILEVGEVDGRPYAVLQLAGVELLAHAALDMVLEEKVRVVRAIALAVHAAHEAGCVHGAFGPASVLVERGDDGAAEPRVLGFRAMTPVDRQACVLALGELLDQLGGARMPRDLDSVVGRCRQAAPGERYPTALELARDLERYLDGEPVTARQTGVLGRLRGWLHRRRAPLAIVGVAAAVALAAGLATHVAARAERRAVVGRELARGRSAVASARQLATAAGTVRAQALAGFRDGGGADAEAAWARAADVRAQCELEYARAERAFEAALVWDPGRADVRLALAGALFDEAVLAEDQRDLARRDALLARLALYDRDQRMRRDFDAPPVLELVTRPAGAAVEIRRYVADARGLLVDGPVAEVGPTPAVIGDLGPGSYLLVVQAAGREPVRYPVVLRPRASTRLDLELPRAGSVPADLSYVAPGRGFVGSDAPGLRAVTEAMPLHEVDTAGYLIARTETTVADWIAYLDALPADERDRRRPRARHFGAAVELVPGPDGWAYQVEHAAGWRAVARAGQPLVHLGRSRRAAQDWRRFPVTGIALDDAVAYAAWLDRTGRVPGARLCTELELERAARGADERRFPRGATLEPDDANLLETYRTVGLGLDEVGSHPGSRSPFGVDDLIGNAGELVAPGLAGAWASSAGAEDFAELSSAGIGRRSLMPRGFRTPTTGVRVCATPRGLF